MKGTRILSEQEAAVRRVEAAIVAAEGLWHVAGRYYADARNAAQWRRWEAESRVREEVRASRRCVWCARPIADSETFVEIGSRNFHESCASEFDEWAYGPSKARAL